MATYLRGVTDTVPVMAPFQPDLSLAQKTMGTLQHRYDQGFAAVSGAYQQVLQSPLSDPANQQARSLFIQHAEQQLRDLSGADLSLPENQQAAEQVFAPFWRDTLMLKDASLTKWYQAELQKAYNARDSSDEKIRSQYSDVAVRYLQNGLEQLAAAGRDPDRYRQLEQRRFVPFQNMEAYLNEQAKESGLKIEWSAAEGPYLVNTINGARSVTAFETFAHNMLGNNFTEQFRVMGVVEKEERLRQLRARNPLLTDAGALQEMARSVVSELSSGIAARTRTIKDRQQQVAVSLEGYESMPVLNPAQKNAYVSLLQDAAQLKGQLTAIEEEAGTLERDKANLHEKVVNYPDNYFAGVMKQRAVRGWSQARAAAQQTYVAINPVWKENNEISYRERTLELEQRKYELEKWKAEQKVLQDSNTKTKGGSSKTIADPNPETAGRYDGLGTTDVTRVGNAYQVFLERQQQRWDLAHQAIFDIHTGAGSTLSTLGVNDADAVRYMDMLKVFSNDPGIKGHFTSEDMRFFRSIGEKLKVVTGIDAGSGFFNARTALLEATRKNLEKKLETGGSGLTPADMETMVNYVAATKALEEHDSLEAERSRLVKERIVNDYGTYARILAPRGNGFDVSTVDDVKKDFKPIELTSKETNQKKTLSPQEFATLYLNGQFRYLEQGEVAINKQLYDITGFEGKEGLAVIRAFNNYYYDRHDDLLRPANPGSLEAKYGTSADQLRLRQQLNQSVVPHLPEYQNETGKAGFVVRYDLADKTSGDVGARLINEAAQPSNREGIYVDRELSDDADINRAVVHLAKMGEDELEKYVSTALLKTVGINGRPSLELVFKPIKSNDKTVVGDMDLTALSGKTIEVDLNPQASGETLRKIHYNPGYYIYGSLLRGVPLKSDKMLEAAGFSFEVTPDSRHNPQRALVRIHHKEYTKDGFTDMPDIKEAFSFGEKSPDEIVQFLYLLFQQHLLKNQALQSQYQQQHQEEQALSPQQIRDVWNAAAGLPGGR